MNTTARTASPQGEPMSERDQEDTMTYRGEYRAGEMAVTTGRAYETPELAWNGLALSLMRRGIRVGPWHLPGRVAGDVGGVMGVVARAGGAASITVAS